MAKIRKITVNKKSYCWRFRYEDQEYSQPAYVLIFPEENHKFEIRVSFLLIKGSIEKYLLNEGFKVRKENTEIIINLNEPRYIAEFIKYFNQCGLDMTESKKISYDGEKLLKILGYKF